MTIYASLSVYSVPIRKSTCSLLLGQSILQCIVEIVLGLAHAQSVLKAVVTPVAGSGILCL